MKLKKLNETAIKKWDKVKKAFKDFTIIYVNSENIGRYGELDMKFTSHKEIVYNNINKKGELECYYFSDTLVILEKGAVCLAEGIFRNAKGNIMFINYNGFSTWFDKEESKTIYDNIDYFHSNASVEEICYDIKYIKLYNKYKNVLDGKNIIGDVEANAEQVIHKLIQDDEVEVLNYFRLGDNKYLVTKLVFKDTNLIFSEEYEELQGFGLGEVEI